MLVCAELEFKTPRAKLKDRDGYFSGVAGDCPDEFPDLLLRFRWDDSKRSPRLIF